MPGRVSLISLNFFCHETLIHEAFDEKYADVIRPRDADVAFDF